MKILVTGAAGFIGFHLAKVLCERGDEVVGIDNLNAYYEVSLKENRLKQLESYDNFRFIRLDIANQKAIAHLFETEHFDKVVNLAAQAGVRYSIENPQAYIESNIIGFTHILEGCRHQNIQHLVYASSSSVYGANTKQPFSENDTIDHPVALYAASKKSNELMAHAYASLYQLPCTGLRFFTVYGPWGRPDMALFKFVKNILEDKPIEVYNNGQMWRDFTYIDDIIAGIISALDHPAKPNSHWDSNHPDPASSYAPWRIYNIGHGKPVNLMDFIVAIEKSLGKTAVKKLLPMQAGDVPNTYASTALLTQDLAYTPKVDIQTGITAFINWYKMYYPIGKK